MKNNVVTMVVCSSILALAALTGCNADHGKSVPAGTSFQAQIGADTKAEPKPEAKAETAARNPATDCNCAPPVRGGAQVLCTCK
jgi:hypothetical protein